MLMPEDEDGNQPDQTGNWQYDGDEDSGSGGKTQHSEPLTATWHAQEFIEHQKDAGWYFGLAVIAILFAVLVYFISSQDWVPVGVVLITAVAFGVFASRKPRELEYQITQNGVRIGNKLYPFSGFKSFSQVEEDGHPAIWLLPLKRFMPIISLYFKPEEEPQIIDALAVNLPFEQREPGIVDHLMQRLKF